MPHVPKLGSDVFLFLAEHQGQQDDPLPEEELSKIPHNMGKGELSRAGLLPLILNYGSVDSTPLFVATLQDYHECTGDVSLIRRDHIGKPLWNGS